MQVIAIAVPAVAHVADLPALFHLLPIRYLHPAQMGVQGKIAVGMPELHAVSIRSVPTGALVVPIASLAKHHRAAAVGNDRRFRVGFPAQVNAAVPIPKPLGDGVFLGRKPPAFRAHGVPSFRERRVILVGIIAVKRFPSDHQVVRKLPNTVGLPIAAGGIPVRHPFVVFVQNRTAELSPQPG